MRGHPVVRTVAGLILSTVLSHVAVADRGGSWTGFAGRANAAAGVAALPVPRFSSASWIGAGKNPFRMVAADLNGDGKADLAVVDRSASTVSVRFGDGTGQFGPRTAYGTARSPLGLVTSDFNGDGALDLASASTGAAKSITVFINDGAGRFRRAGAYAAGREACGIAAGDVNGDGIVDLLSAHASRKHFTVLLGRGAGAFRVAHRYRGGQTCDVTAAELNGDGKLDVALADSDVAVRLGGGDGTFGAAAVYRSGSSPFGVTVADLNHDGRFDVAAANCCPDASVSVLLGAANGSFGPSKQYPMGDEFEDYVDTVLVADYDRDGHLDIATPGQPSVRRGRGDGTFERRQQAFDGFAYTQAGAVADFNGDGWPDLAFSEACNESEVDCDRYPARSIVVLLNWTGQSVPPCVVPALVGAYGANERQSRRQLARAGCRGGHVSHRYSRRGRKGTVIAQRPRPGAVRPNDSPVTLVVSRGRRH